MNILKSIIAATLLVTAIAVLTGCNTAKGVGKDVEAVGRGVEAGVKAAGDDGSKTAY